MVNNLETFVELKRLIVEGIDDLEQIDGSELLDIMDEVDQD